MARSRRTPYVILGLLGMSGTEPRTGYEIKKVIDSIISHFWSESHGQLYPVLSQLSADGLIRGREEKSSGRRKTSYTITAKGRERLRAWLTAPVESTSPRDELILKLFFGSEADPAILISHLQRHRVETCALLEQCSRWEHENKANPTRYGVHLLLTIRAGSAMAQARLKWIDESIATLEQLSRTASKS